MKILIMAFLLLFSYSYSFAEIWYEVFLDIKENKENYTINGKLKIKSNEDFKISIPANIKVLENNSNFIKFSFNIKKGKYPELFITQTQLPYINKLAKYKVKIKPPKNFIPITEADIVRKEDNIYIFEFPYPKDQLTIILGKNWKIKKLSVRKDLEIFLYSLNKTHKQNPLNLAKKYILYYENLIGKFPYKRFSIVETYGHYGFSFPTFTTIFFYLMNKDFIYKTSLPHEILHQWFGCSVYVDFKKGNWSEGLTVYLSDYHFNKDKAIYRKELLEKYEAYIDKDLPLKDFIYKKDKKSEALGYGKGMFVFYMLENKIGKKAFLEGLKDFYIQNKFKKTSWQQLKASFNKYSKYKLDTFFKQWVYSKYVPSLSLKVKNVIYKDNAFEISFILTQKKSFKIDLPIYVKTLENLEKFTLKLKQKEQKFTIKTKSMPLKIYIDPKYQIFRHLLDEETEPIIHFALNKNNTIVASSNTTTKDIENKNVIFYNAKNPILKNLTNINFDTSKEFALAVKNPLGEKKILLIVSGDINYKHYGNYSKITKTKEGIKKEKGLKTFSFGFDIFKLPEVIDIHKGSLSYRKLLENLSKERLIYIGENHTKFSNHIVQLQIIKKLYKQNKNIIIAMEMFQRPFQKYLDDFINGKLTERQFLEKIEYYKRWGYDYKLYKPIIDFAKKNKIKIVALNVEKEIIDKVSKKGISSLSKDDLSKIPQQLDFSNLEYRKFLKKIFLKHNFNKNFVYFYQSQILWDETMAYTLANYIKKFPNFTFIVLAGNGHLRFRYGIPSRAERLTKIKGVVVLNDDEIRENIADFVIYPPNIDYKPSVKLGVFILEENGKLVVKETLKNSIASKLGIKKNDIILKVDGFSVKNIYDLKTHLTFFKEGSYVVVKRKGKNLTLIFNR